jgi:hypothetical protein
LRGSIFLTRASSKLDRLCRREPLSRLVQPFDQQDGRTWTAVNLPDGISQPDVISGGQHNLIVEPAQSADALGYVTAVSGQLGLRTIDDGFRLVSVAQSGDVPQLLYSNWGGGTTYGMVALGPTGVLVTNADGSQLWFGTPSAE